MFVYLKLPIIVVIGKPTSSQPKEAFSIQQAYTYILYTVIMVIMIEHVQTSFDDAPLKPYRFSKRLIRNHFADECEVFLVHGSPEGVGKTAYISHVLADVHGYLDCHDKDLLRAMWVKAEEAQSMEKWQSNWEAVKNYTHYPPDEVVDKCLYMLDNELVDVAFHWDDAGTWLYVMSFHDPFVIAFMKYLPLARSNWKGGVILSTPFVDWVLNKLRTSEGVLQIKVTKPPGDSYKYDWKPRIATCYRKNRPYPGARTSYWPRQFIDRFVAIMPDEFYNWYGPRRNKYAKIIATQMKESISKKKERGWNVSDGEEHLQEMEDHVWEANYKATELEEAINSVEKTSVPH